LRSSDYDATGGDGVEVNLCLQAGLAKIDQLVSYARNKWEEGKAVKKLLETHK
jgi:hypothetical protein